MRTRESKSRLTRRSVLWLGGGTLGAIALAACGQAAAPAAPADEAPAAKEAEAQKAEPQAEPVTLNWSLWGDSTWLEAAQAGADQYTADNPNVTVNVAGYKESLAGYITAWLAGAGPDVAMMWGTNLVQAGREGLLVNMDSYIKRDNHPMDDYIPFQVGAMYWPDTGQFGLPMYINVYVLWYNRQLFDQKGLTYPDDTWGWDEYQNALLRLTDRNANVFGGVDMTWQRGIWKIIQNGGTVVDPEDDRHATFDSPEAIEAMEWLHARFHQDRSMVHGEEWKALERSKVQALMQGTLATWEEGSWGPGQYSVDFPEQVDFWDVAPLPQGPVGRATQGSIDAWVLWEGTKDPDVAWDFQKFLQSDVYLDLQCQIASIQHPRASMQDRYISIMRENFPPLVDKNLDAFAHPVRGKYAWPNGGLFRNDAEVFGLIGEAWTASIIEDRITVAEAFTDSAKRANALMAEG